MTTTDGVKVTQYGYLRAHQFGVPVRTPSDAAQMLVEMGYTYRVKSVEEWPNIEGYGHTSRIASEVFVVVPDSLYPEHMVVHVLLAEVRDFVVTEAQVVCAKIVLVEDR